MLAGPRNTGRVDLGETGVGEIGTAPVRPPHGGGVGVHGVRREIEDVAIATAGQDDRVRKVGVDPAGDEIPCHDAARPSVDHDQVEHLGARMHLDVAGRDLPRQRLIRTEQKLLARLAAGVEGAGHLDTTEGTGVEQTPVLPRERHALGHALVDDLDRDLREAVDVGLTGPEVSALDGVVEQPVDGVAVVAVVLRRVDAALGGDRVGAAGRVLVAELDDVVALFGERGARRAARETGAHDDHRVLAAVGGVDELGLEAAGVPAFVDRAGRGLGVDDRLTGRVVRVFGGSSHVSSRLRS